MADTIRVTQAGATVAAEVTTPPLHVTQAGATVAAEVTTPPLHVTQAGATVAAEIAAPPSHISQAGATVVVVPLEGVFSAFGGGALAVSVEGLCGKQENTLYIRQAYGLGPFSWAGKSAAIARVVRDTGKLIPTLTAGHGSPRISGAISGAPGGVASTVTLTESSIRSTGNSLLSCLWDLDRRACFDAAHWDGWKTILRLAHGRATTITYAAAGTGDKPEVALASVSWSATDTCEIRRVTLSIHVIGG